MASYSNDTKTYHKERIRDVLAIKPTASIVTIKRVLESNQDDPLVLDRMYISKLLGIIRSERRTRFRDADVNAALAELQDQGRALNEAMWSIVLDTRASKAARTMAAGRIIESNYKFWEAQLNAGVFERKLGEVKVALELERKNAPLPEDIQDIMLKALTAQGLIKAPPKHVDAITIEPKQIAPAA